MKTKLWPVVLLVAPLAALAQSASDEDETLDVVVVTAHPLAEDGIAQANVTLAEEALKRAMDTSIGTTVAGLPGVHVGDFGPNAGRPVIRGLSGPRVRVMQDRVDTLDVSVTSADHAITTDAFVAQSIEILKGPSTLLYGSGSIGGVVNVATNRIPQAVPEKAVGGRLELRQNDNGDQTTAALLLDGGSGNFAWHFDAFDRSADEYDIPGFAESAGQRALEEAEGGEEEEEEEEAFGVLPGSQLDASGFAVGGSYITDRVVAGISINTYDADYGLPGGHAHEEGEEGEEEEEEGEGNPLIELEQQRVDLELAVNNPFGGFDALSFRFGINDYEHMEIEPNGEVATLFENDAYEGRIELSFGADAVWRGVVGLQLSDREFSAVGEEAFVEPVDTLSQAIFFVTERDVFSAAEFEIGARLEQVDHDSSTGVSRDFSALSVSAGLSSAINDNLSFAVTADISSRAPVAEELFSNGPHLATGAFEIGDVTLDEERVFALSTTFSYANEKLDWSASIYYNDFSGFIYETPTGEVEDGLPVFQFFQDDAEVYGLELEIGYALTEQLRVAAIYDTVEAHLEGAAEDEIPRLPPSSFGLSVGYDQGPFSAELTYRRVDDQNEVTRFELPTDGFDDLGLFAQYSFDLSGRALDVFFNGTNLTDDEQRHHASFIKDFAPRRGRTIEVGARLAF
ncbi:MAG: TonB-dependent receptor [Pseudomonadota bacterium]